MIVALLSLAKPRQTIVRPSDAVGLGDAFIERQGRAEFRSRPVVVGAEKRDVAEALGEVRQRVAPLGQIQVAGELWAAEIDPHDAAIEEGARVEVTGVHGLRLKVRRWDRKPG